MLTTVFFAVLSKSGEHVLNSINVQPPAGLLLCQDSIEYLPNVNLAQLFLLNIIRVISVSSPVFIFLST